MELPFKSELNLPYSLRFTQLNKFIDNFLSKFQKNLGKYFSSKDLEKKCFQIMGLPEGNYKVFSVKGDSMAPTIMHDEVLVCQLIEQWDGLESGKPYVITTNQDTFVKRVLTSEYDPEGILLKSDNPVYRTVRVSRNTIKYIWQIIAKFTIFLDNVWVSNAQKLLQLEREIQLIKSQLNT